MKPSIRSRSWVPNRAMKRSTWTQNKTRIAGRKYYFHQPRGIPEAPQTKTRYNEHIIPVDTGSQFEFSLQFTNLETLELQTLLYTLVLEQNMRHKIGYAKPAGFGSVCFDITKLTLIDYASRYVANQGGREYEGEALSHLPIRTDATVYR